MRCFNCRAECKLIVGAGEHIINWCPRCGSLMGESPDELRSTDGRNKRHVPELTERMFKIFDLSLDKDTPTVGQYANKVCEE